ncbi:MAG: protein kinase [Proteobacteria bacterium]|nr:protein kinase [Pseudomonadota bacterium]
MRETEKKYQVLRKIGEGGMAEVYIADMLCQPGYKKRVAVKRVLPKLAQNHRFIRMFLDEARLGLLLNHSNIVHMFDVGRANGAYFIVMEYVNGVNLKEICEFYGAQQTLVPIEVTVAIAIEIARGLDYAHRLTDRDGNLLRVVHNDINPANVLLSENGEIKLVDFGLSEAAVHVEKTDPDIVRGKFGYLSPEAAWGHGTDSRADIYAVGVILYEMLTGYKLFRGDTDLASIQLAREARVPPPRHYNSDITGSLERVLYHALAKHPNDRCSTARQLGHELSQIIFELGRAVDAFSVGDMVTMVRNHRRSERSERAALIEMMIEEELMGFESLDYDEPEITDYGSEALW